MGGVEIDPLSLINTCVCRRVCVCSCVPDGEVDSMGWNPLV